MTAHSSRRLVAALAIVFCGVIVGAHADEFNPAGKWVLLNDWGWPSQRAIVEVRPADDRFDARLIDAPPNQRPAEVKNFSFHDGHVTFSLARQGGQELVFDGALAAEGRYAGQFLGTARGRYLDPARLQRTDAEQLAKHQPPPYQDQLDAARAAPDERERAVKLIDVIRQHPGPVTNFEFRHLLISAETAGLTKEQVGGLLRDWFAGAEAYGPAFVAEAHLVVLRSLRGQRKFASAAVDVAEQARQHIGNLSSAEDQSSLLHFLADAARLSGRDDVAEAAEAQADEIDARLDADYSEKVPPFKFKGFAGREKAAANRVVLLELFTGGLCPPCVACDVACDALDTTYKPSELILLQYHLHIPGADPLTNPSSIARQEYYAIRGVPWAFFNGVPCPTGGGDMTAAEAKYHDYRQQIEELLGETRSAEIELSVSRAGDVLTIHAAADAAPDRAQPITEDSDANPPARPDLRLRFVLTEELVRHDGGNGIRFNRHVVRDFPGDLAGTPLDDGHAAIELTTDLSEVRGRLNEYSRSIAHKLALICPRPLPRLRLDHLALVAFVQDDVSKQVLHAVQVAVPKQ